MKINSKTIFLVLLAVMAIITAICIQLLREDAFVRAGQNPISEADLTEGKILAEQYCASCHLYPEPDLLPKRTWRSQTLPHMGPQLGIFQHNGDQYPVEKTPNLPENYYPSRQQISNEKWQKILDYYIKTAPEELPPTRKETTIITNQLFFKAHTPDYREQTPPMVTAVRFDPGNHLIYLSDASEARFLIFDRDLNLKDRYDLTSAISDIQISNDLNKSGIRDLLTTYIGDVNPSDALTGFIQKIQYDPAKEEGSPGSVLYDDMARPVESQYADLNQDGRKDILISEFGHRTGGLFWLKNMGQGAAPEKKMLRNTPGCIQSHITDYTDNGLPDIVALCTQADQSVYLFKNQGKGTFIRERLLQFQITAGSSSLEMYDFNGDGHLDILYTSGDNADYSITYKPYHGVYIYLNDGNGNFNKSWFYPVNGAYNAVAHDFDGDGNLDLAVISFFADYRNRPEEGFILFKGKGNLAFTPYHHPTASAGRWIAMDVADWDGDGDEDIVLGNFSVGPTKVIRRIQNKWAQGPQFLLLENTSLDGNF